MRLHQYKSEPNLFEAVSGIELHMWL